MILAPFELSAALLLRRLQLAGHLAFIERDVGDLPGLDPVEELRVVDRCVVLEHVRAARMGRVLHVGAYGDEEQSFAKILAAVESAGLRSTRTHLEVYLSDPRRTAQTKLRTVLLLELEA